MDQDLTFRIETVKRLQNILKLRFLATFSVLPLASITEEAESAAMKAITYFFLCHVLTWSKNSSSNT